jgi:DNA-directed RNA polymerase subunit RPC12/RpoP
MGGGEVMDSCMSCGREFTGPVDGWYVQSNKILCPDCNQKLREFADGELADKVRAMLPKEAE